MVFDSGFGSGSAEQRVWYFIAVSGLKFIIARWCRCILHGDNLVWSHV